MSQTAPEEESTGVLAPLIGHEGAKAVLRAALRRGDVHVLLEGPPASGKSIALLAIEGAVPDAAFKDARGFTETQLRETLAKDHDILLLDELDAMKGSAYEALPVPMEQGRVTKDTAHDSYDIEIDTQIIAACNDASDLPRHVASRFRTVKFDEYSRDEFLRVCARLIYEQIEWATDIEGSKEVARVVEDATGTRDPRQVLDAAKLSDNPSRVREMAVALQDADADIKSDAITPDEIHALKKGRTPTRTEQRNVEDSIMLLRRKFPRMTESIGEDDLRDILTTWEDLRGGGPLDAQVNRDISNGNGDPAEQTEIEMPGSPEDAVEAAPGIEIVPRPIPTEGEGEDEQPTNSISNGMKLHHRESEHDEVHAAVAAGMGVPPDTLWDGSKESEEPGWDLYYRFDISRSSPGNPWSSGKLETDDLIDELAERGVDAMIVTQGIPLG